MSTKNKRGKIKYKNVAKCLFCGKVLKNVVYNRLLGHRYVVVQVSNCRILLFLFIQIFVRLCNNTIFLSIPVNILTSNS